LHFGIESSKTTVSLLGFSIYMLRSILGQMVKSIGIFQNTLISLLKLQKLFQLHPRNTSWHELCTESCLELLPSDCSSSRLPS
jgi:hypothetical protein